MNQSRNAVEGRFNGRFATFKGPTKFTRSKKTSLRARSKEKRDWERKLAAATPEQRSAMIWSRAFNSAASQESTLGDALFPIRKEAS